MTSDIIGMNLPRSIEFNEHRLSLSHYVPIFRCEVLFGESESMKSDQKSVVRCALDPLLDLSNKGNYTCRKATAGHRHRAQATATAYSIHSMQATGHRPPTATSHQPPKQDFSIGA
eukprot:scaffold145_cov66-Cyclotella_meneghiniana.AAC.5